MNNKPKAELTPAYVHVTLMETITIFWCLSQTPDRNALAQHQASIQKKRKGIIRRGLPSGSRST